MKAYRMFDCGDEFYTEDALLVEKGSLKVLGYSDLILVNREFIWSDLLRAIRLYNNERRRVK